MVGSLSTVNLILSATLWSAKLLDYESSSENDRGLVNAVVLVTGSC